MKAYEPQGLVEKADCLIGFSFGSSTGEGSVNNRLAEVMVDLANGRPMIADRTLVDALPGVEEQMACTVEGSRVNMMLQGVGTWGVIIKAQKYMSEHDLHLPILVAQAYHVRRVGQQVLKAGILETIIPPGLPRSFDPDSEQIWTRSEQLWRPINWLGSFMLKCRGQL